jgi:ABC-type maltose transport system permease subunit
MKPLETSFIITDITIDFPIFRTSLTNLHLIILLQLISFPIIVILLSFYPNPPCQLSLCMGGRLSAERWLTLFTRVRGENRTHLLWRCATTASYWRTVESGEDLWDHNKTNLRVGGPICTNHCSSRSTQINNSCLHSCNFQSSPFRLLIKPSESL